MHASCKIVMCLTASVGLTLLRRQHAGKTAVISCSCMQRDLKSENIMLREMGANGDLRALVGDLGVAKSMLEQSYANSDCGTRSCSAPEILFTKRGSLPRYKPKEVDVYGVGKPCIPFIAFIHVMPKLVMKQTSCLCSKCRSSSTETQGGSMLCIQKLHTHEQATFCTDVIVKASIHNFHRPITSTTETWSCIYALAQNLHEAA